MKGTYEHNIDAKGRLFIPAKLKDELGDAFVITKGLDGCLSLYSQKNWGVLEEKIASLPLSKARNLQRFFLSGAMDCELDSQGRVVVPQKLREYAGISKEVVVIGMVNHAEVWDAEKWREYNDGISEEDVLEAMEDLGI